MLETKETRSFYDQTGWRVEGGVAKDRELFGVKEDGPIRIALHAIRTKRIREALTRTEGPLNILECGCGGQPAHDVLDLCSSYTGVDFSERGIAVARRALTDAPIRCELCVADVRCLPFPDKIFDAIYSAHMIYHIAETAGQRDAMSEMCRVVRPGGIIMLITANPFPLFSPIRFFKRLLASTPVIRDALNLIRKRPPLPYRPMSIGWMKRQLERYGDVSVTIYSLPSLHFNQHVSELRGIGRVLWQVVRYFDVYWPHASAYLGNYVLLRIRRSS
jgi:ubiquinone/menaquinone biosynthesis C-methylase UbiE